MQKGRQAERSRSRVARLAVIGALAGVLSVFAGQTAIAAITNTTRAAVLSVPGNCYEGRSQTNTNLATPTAYAYGWAMTAGCGSATSVPAGYMQVQAISSRNGVVCANVVSAYNASSTSNMSTGAARNCGSGNYTSRAGVYGYRTDSGFYSVGYTSFTAAAAF